MPVNTMKATIIYDCKCDYCGRSLISSMGTYEEKPSSKRTLNIIAREHGWCHDDILDKNICTDKRCKIKRTEELNLVGA